MSALEQSLADPRLMRVHRSAFVRLDLVEQIRREPTEALSIVLRNGVEMRVGPNYAAELLKRVGATGT
jgi:DNA-binding LytR/AlgR family response regulator